MTQRRQAFRLRIPWPFAPVAKPTKDRTKIPTNSDTNVPIQRPTSPSKEAPSPVVPQKQSPPPHPTQPATSSVIIESSLPSFQRPSSYPGSPSRVSIASSSPKTRPQSPSHSAWDGVVEVAKPAADEERFWPASSSFEQEKEKKVVYEKPMPQEAEPKVSSPLKSPQTDFRPERMSIQPQDSEQQAPPMPSSPVSKTKPAVDQPPHPSPPLASEHTSEVLRPNIEENTLPASPASQEEKEKTMVEAVSELVPQEIEPKMKSPLGTIPKSPETSFWPLDFKQKASSVTSSPVQPPPLSLASENTGKMLKPNAEESNFPASQEEKERKAETVSESVLQEAKPKIESPESSFQNERMSTQPQGSQQQQQASSVPSSPVSKTEPASDQPPCPSSPSASEHTGEASKPDTEESTVPSSSASQEEKEKTVEAVSEPMPQEIEPKVKSPLKTVPKSPEASFQQIEPPQPSSPLAPDRISEALKPNAEETTLPASSASEEEKEKMALAVSEQVPQEVEPKMKSPLKTIPKSPETSSKPENLSKQPTPIIGDKKRSATPETDKLDLDSAAESSKAPLKTQSKLHESEEKEKEVHEPTKARNAKDVASASGTKAKDRFSRPFRADMKRRRAHETVERKMMFSASKPSEKGTRFASSPDRRTRTVSSITPERSVSSNKEKAPLQQGIKDDISKFVHKLANVDPTQPVDDTQLSAITLAGDNRGATMQLVSESAKNEGSIEIRQADKADPEEISEVITNVEEDTKKESQSLANHDGVGKAYVNSNIQSINNSLMVHGSITERDPGVQVTLPQKPGENSEG